MYEEQNGIPAIVAANLNPLLDAAERDEHRLLYTGLRVNGERQRICVLPPCAVTERAGSQDECGGYNAKKYSQCETHCGHAPFRARQIGRQFPVQLHQASSSESSARRQRRSAHVDCARRTFLATRLINQNE